MIRTNLLLAGDDGGYNLTKSLRFRSSASAYLNRTFGTPTSGTTWTFSAWIKFGTVGAGTLFSAGTGATNTFNRCTFGQVSTELNWRQVNGAGSLTAEKGTSMLFRDPSAWYHIVCVWDTNNATSSDRQRVYVNGVRVTSFGANTDPSSGLVSYFNTSSYAHYIGALNLSGLSTYFDGYQTEINFIDGQALTPSSFGSTNATTGVWQPAKYTGTYGTNGFYLPFTNTTSTTTLGYDFSGNSNNWTTNYLSLTAGSTYDSMNDVPTLTSATTANYCVLNPLTNGSFTTLSGANLNTLGNSSSNNGNSRSSFAMITGKWYIEATLTAGSVGTYPQYGIVTSADGNRPNNGPPQAGYASGLINPTQSVAYFSDGTKQINGSATSYGNSYTNGDVIGIAIDSDNGAIYFSKNGTFQNSGVPTSGVSKTGAALTWTGGTVEHMLSIAEYNGSSSATNFGQRPFAYTPPTGFVALNTYNLPTSTIVKGNTVMDATTYTGNGATQSIVNTAGFKPDFVWVKGRSNVIDHILFDSVRGVTKRIYTNGTFAEDTDANSLTSFNNNGFTYGSGAGNNSSQTFVGWQWQAGQGSTSSNTSGSITSTVSVNASAGFSVVTFNSTSASGTSTIGHGLGVVPAMLIMKDRTSAYGWDVWTKGLGAITNSLILQSTAAVSTTRQPFGSVSPTSSVFTFNNAFYAVSNDNIVVYAWAEIAGYSAFGSYTGNGSTDGPFVYTGFRPKFVIFKRSDSTGNWQMIDTSINPYNNAGTDLFANLSNAETSGYAFDILSNGFKQRDNGAGQNASGGTYIYMAFAENPFKNALAR